MQINFYTSYLNKRFYKQVICNYVFDHLDGIMNEVEMKRIENNINQFKIFIYPTTAYESIFGGRDWRSGDTGKLSDMIPHEIVGLNEIRLFLVDVDKDINRASN